MDFTLYAVSSLMLHHFDTHYTIDLVASAEQHGILGPLKLKKCQQLLWEGSIWN